MTEASPVVFIVDDDLSVRRSTERLLRAAGLEVQTFTSAREFLKNPGPEGPACLVLDVRMPGLSGMELQRELTQSGFHVPIIFVTAHGDIPMSVRAMKAGAAEFLTKPFRGRILLDAVRAARIALSPAVSVTICRRKPRRLLPTRSSRLAGIKNPHARVASTSFPCAMRKWKIYEAVAASRPLAQNLNRLVRSEES